MADPVTALVVVAAGATVGKAVMQYESAQDKERALDLQSQENMLSYQEKSLSNLDATQKILDRQIAQSTVRGIAADKSPSFNAIQRETLNISAKTGKNLELGKTLSDENIDIEKSNVKNTLYAQLFGDVGDAAMSFAKLQGGAASTQ